MIPAYKTETMETVYTYTEWEKIYKKNKARQKEKAMYFIKQKIIGLILSAVGIATTVLLKDATVLIVAFPIGMVLIFTKEKVML